MNAGEYYDISPQGEHRAGDIWSDVPTLGMLPLERTTAIIVTPACDLQNRKSPTLTYLPILPLRCAFCLPPLSHEILRSLNGQLTSLGLGRLCVEIPSSTLPQESYLREVDASLAGVEGSKGCGDKEKTAILRVRSCLNILRVALSRALGEAALPTVQGVFGDANYQTLLERVITNAARHDLHFLPDDRQRKEWSGVPEHSVVFFRYPLSAPVEVFDKAQDMRILDWDEEMRNLGYLGSGVSRFAGARPVRRVTVRPRYVADLLTRYVAMHVRLGSPDFSDETVKMYVQELRGK